MPATRQLRTMRKLLAAELERQIEPDDGGHISRNPWTPLSCCSTPAARVLRARRAAASAGTAECDRPATAMLHHLRLGDGQLARFNGMGVASAML